MRYANMNDLSSVAACRWFFSLRFVSREIAYDGPTVLNAGSGSTTFASFTRVDGASGDASFDSVLEDCAEVTYHTVDSVRGSISCSSASAIEPRLDVWHLILTMGTHLCTWHLQCVFRLGAHHIQQGCRCLPSHTTGSATMLSDSSGSKCICMTRLIPLSPAQAAPSL